MKEWAPLPKQRIALSSRADEILYGGARGGGKTEALIMWLLYFYDRKDYRALCIRRNYTDLVDWVDRAHKIYSKLGATRSGDKFVFRSGAIIRFGHLADKDAYQKYQGHEYQRIAIEELTHIPRMEDYENLLGSNRSTTDIKPQVFCTTNPDGAGHEWVRKRWNIPEKPTEVVKTEENGRTRIFIPSNVDDNPYINKEYKEYLESIQDEEMRKAWLEGYWGGFTTKGAYYAKQIQKLKAEGRHNLDLYDSLLPVYTWCDLGIGDSFAIVYIQIAENYRVIDYDEIEGEGLQYVANLMGSKGYTYATHYAPHDINVRELGTGLSRLEVAKQYGINYEIAPKLPVDDGINALRMKFDKLYFDKKASLLLNRLENYRKEFDERLGIYKSKPVHDINSHGADAMRYFATTNTHISQRVEEHNKILMMRKRMARY